ncbi:MAG: hypothetical protein V2A74_01005 [bacterium]
MSELHVRYEEFEELLECAVKRIKDKYPTLRCRKELLDAMRKGRFSWF